VKNIIIRSYHHIPAGSFNGGDQYVVPGGFHGGDQYVVPGGFHCV